MIISMINLVSHPSSTSPTFHLPIVSLACTYMPTFLLLLLLLLAPFFPHCHRRRHPPPCPRLCPLPPPPPCHPRPCPPPPPLFCPTYALLHLFSFPRPIFLFLNFLPFLSTIHILPRCVVVRGWGGEVGGGGEERERKLHFYPYTHPQKLL